MQIVDHEIFEEDDDFNDVNNVVYEDAPKPNTTTSGIKYSTNVLTHLTAPSSNGDDIDNVHDSWKEYLTRQQKDAKFTDSQALRINELIKQTTIMAWICHIKFLSDICDHPLTRGAVLSVFPTYKDPPNPFTIFEFIRVNFRVATNYNIWCLDELTVKHLRGALFFKIFRSVYFRKASVVIATIIFVTICRHFGYFCRIILDIPKSLGSDALKSVKVFAQVYDPLSKSWTSVDFMYFTFDKRYIAPRKNPVKWTVKQILEDIQADSDSSVRKLNYRGKIYVFKPEKIFIFKSDLMVKNAIFSPGATRLTQLRIAPKYLISMYHISDDHDISIQFCSKRLVGLLDVLVDDAQRGLYIISCCNFGYFNDLTMCFHNKWYYVISKRKRKFHKWLTDLISSLQEKALTNKRVAKYKTHLKYLHDLDNRILSEKMNTIESVDSKSWIANHPVFILESQVGKTQMIAKEAEVLGDIKGDKIYYRRSVLQLKTPMGWHREMRRIKPNETPVRTIVTKRKLPHRFLNKHLINHIEHTKHLYSIDQTEPELTASFAESITSYNNVDLTGNRAIPENSLHIDGNYHNLIVMAAEHAKISYASALVSFKYEGPEIKPLIRGVVIEVPDRDKFLDSYLYVLNNMVDSKKDPNLEYWKICFKTLSRYKTAKSKRIGLSKLQGLLEANKAPVFEDG